MDSAQLHLLLAEARGIAEDLMDVAGPVTVSPGLMHALAHTVLDLLTTCQHLHRQNLHWMVAAARQTPPGDVR
jgi:hypothetical protein